jgi:predicted nucleotidyltransferase
LDEVLVRVPSFESKEELEKLLLSLVQEYKPECVLLTGSLASGEWVSGKSDVDILVVVEEGKEPSTRFRLESLGKVDVNISVFSLGEILQGVRSLNFFFIEAVVSGIPLYGTLPDAILAEIEELKLERVGRGWRFRNA